MCYGQVGTVVLEHAGAACLFVVEAVKRFEVVVDSRSALSQQLLWMLEAVSVS